MGQIVSSSQTGTECGAVPLIEESSQLLRSLPLSVLAAYAVGTLPFVLGLLFFWSDMSRSALAARHCSAGALGSGPAFHLDEMLADGVLPADQRLVDASGTAPLVVHRPGSYGRTAEPGAGHRVHVLLPLAVLFTVPTAWVYAFYQNVTVLDDGGPEGLVALIRRAWHQAVLWPKQNHLILLDYRGLRNFRFTSTAFCYWH
jgi:hypothetical protein